MNRNEDVILTGIPRSGTTLACALLNKLPDTVALNEPMDPARFLAATESGGHRDRIDRFFARTRASLSANGTATSKHAAGAVVDNNFGEHRNGGGRRAERVLRGTASFKGGLAEGFLLCLKHPGLYTALLESLTSSYRCFAMIRNPLAVLGSWNSVDISAASGRSLAAEWLRPELAQALASIPDTCDRQVYLLSWYFERYRRLLPASAIIRYEDLVATGGSALSVVTPKAWCLDEPLDCRNDSALYDKLRMRELGGRLLRSEGAYWDFYTRESVEELLLAC